MGRPPADLDDYLDWQERLESFSTSGLDIQTFCLVEGIGRTTFLKWRDRLKNGIPEKMLEEKAAQDRAETADAHRSSVKSLVAGKS